MIFNRTSLTILCSAFSLVACDLDNDLKIDEDLQHIRVYQDDQKLACQPETAISLSASALKLAQENIEIHCSQKADDGLAYPESCGSDTGSINVFTIHKGDLSIAKSLGFETLKTLPQAQFNPQCEYQVISDNYKYHLIHQLKAQIAVWQQADIANYQFNFRRSYIDCPNITAPPEVRITVSDNNITEIYDLDNQVYLDDLTNYSPLSQLLESFKLQLWMTPFYAGRSATQDYELPEYNEFGIPIEYFYDQGSNQCDAVFIHISEFIDLT